MAEQDSHHVVSQTESTSASAPLVDVAANLNNTAAAVSSGQTTTQPQNDAASREGYFSGGGENGTGLKSNGSDSGHQADKAEPSAGDALATPMSEGVDHEYVNGDVIASGDDAHVLESTSDTDGGRTSQIKDEAQHTRTNSVKKPATFSRVSVTKNFLARSATNTPLATKAGEKPVISSISTPASLKPRLIAKTASNLMNVSRSRTGAENAAAPDASKVWNKNRPAPAMPPKQFTDEELKQQYGIHLATRLQSDETGKGSKWADIDDDEDDWAPEAVVWMDGTKSTLAPTDVPTPVEEKSQASATGAQPETAAPNVIAVKKEPSGPPKTILKPGAAVQAKQSNGSGLGSTSDKQTLKAKHAAPVPAKSPWATLPPVEKISPINPPVQSQPPVQQTMMSQDARFSDMPVQMAQPAREIAADTFDRAWRGGEGERRELFNSSSGKYEPAPEGRRSSIRPESYGRKPSVLQRSQDANGSDTSSWPRRRGSSVSQHSGPHRRLSFAKDSDTVISDQHSNAGSGRDPRSAQATPAFPQNSPWSQQLPPAPSAGMPSTPGGEEAEDVLKAQARIMRESREAARQRRQQQEAEEEAAKKARLQAKLDALAGAGQSRKERQAAVTTEPVQAVSSDGKSGDDSAVSQPESHQNQAEAVNSIVQDTEQSAAATKSQDVSAQNQAVNADSSPQLAQREHLSPSTASRTTLQSQATNDLRSTQPSSAFSSPASRDRKPQPFGRSPITTHDAFTPWPSSTGSANVWGNSGIGNGTFESSSLFGLAKPFAIPPGMSGITRQQPGQSATSPNMSRDSASLVDQSQALSNTQMDVRSEHFANQPLNMASAPGMNRQQHVPGPIGPPSRTQPPQVSAWQSAANRLGNQYHSDSMERPQNEDSNIPQKRNDTFRETFRQTSKEPTPLGGPRKFEQARFSVHDSHGTIEENDPVPPNAQSQPSAPIPSASPLNSWKQPGSAVRLPGAVATNSTTSHQHVPINRPNVSISNRPNFNAAPLAPAPAVNDDLPPPPEITSHPVYEGNSSRPNIRLPPPPAVVKLPPSAVSPPIRPLQNLGYGGQRPLVATDAWQARFNGLFNRTPIQTETPPSPPRTPPKPQAPVLAVASSSRIYVEDGRQMNGATVSLPKTPVLANTSSEGFSLDNSSEVTSKAGVQQMFFEELGFGSRPVIRVPRGVYDASIHDQAKINLLDMKPTANSIHSVSPQTQRDLPVFLLFYKKPDGIFVKLSATSRSKLMLHRQKPTRVASGKHNKAPFSKKESVSQGAAKSSSARKSSANKILTTKSSTSAATSTTSNKASPVTTPSRKRSGLHKAGKAAPAATPATVPATATAS